MLTRSRRAQQEFRALVLIVVATALPLFLAFLLVAADMRSDLSDLKPIQSCANNAAGLLGWEDLESHLLETPRQARILGYMMDSLPPSRDGAPAGAFVMMPDAGHILHPAHRIPNQMVEIRLKRSVNFQFRTLVWASGTLVRTASRPQFGHAMYAMSGATAGPASQNDIARCFSP